MKVTVLGAGVTGVTSAWYLADAGHEVVVVDRLPGAGLETSYANGGQISVSQAEPWSNPQAPGKIVKWLGNEEAPLLFRPLMSLGQWRWGLQFLYECLPGRTRDNTLQILALAMFSGEQLKELRARSGVTYDHLERGILQLYFEQSAFEAAKLRADMVRRAGYELRAVSTEQCLQIEPALSYGPLRPVGATFAPKDESGDAYLFTHNLAAICARRGVQFRFDTQIERIEADGAGVRAVHVRGQEGSVRLVADAVLVCLGVQSPFLVEPLGIRLPVYPIKGYSVTIPDAGRRAPSVCLTDEGAKLAMSRLGTRLRVAGTAELNGYDKRINAVRCGAILRRVRELFPEAGDFGRAEQWAGLRPATPGNVPLIGRTRVPGLFVNTGHGTLGWTLCAGSGRAIADIIDGRAPPVAFRFLTGR